VQDFLRLLLLASEVSRLVRRSRDRSPDLRQQRREQHIVLLLHPLHTTSTGMSILVVFILNALIHWYHVVAYWHAYKEEGASQAAECASYGNAKNLTSFVQKAHKWKLWPGLISAFDEANGDALFGVEQAMELIWKNQHPEDCSKAKFMIAQGWTQGFGSEVHLIGIALAVALNSNRVFLMNPEGPPPAIEQGLDNSWQVDTPLCRKLGKKAALECYYEPWSSCTIQDALPGGLTIADIHVHKKTYYSDTEFQNEPKTWKAIENEKTILIESRGDAPHALPKELLPMLQCSPVKPNLYVHWWRSISATYLLRPSQEVLQMMAEYRPSVGFRTSASSPKEQCVSIYVRRGDKHVETIPSPLEYYLDSAKMLWNTGLVPGVAQGDQGIVFIGSEDADVIDQAKAWGATNNFRVLFTTLFDRRQVSAGLNFTIQNKLKKKRKALHHDLEYFSMLFNLDFHLKCSAFVCTIPSNFCRIIDELRATVGGKVDRHYVDVSEMCGTPPCFSHNFNSNWR